MAMIVPELMVGWNYIVFLRRADFNSYGVNWDIVVNICEWSAAIAKRELARSNVTPAGGMSSMTLSKSPEWLAALSDLRLFTQWWW